jgi:hypothetical protein
MVLESSQVWDVTNANCLNAFEGGSFGSRCIVVCGTMLATVGGGEVDDEGRDRIFFVVQLFKFGHASTAFFSHCLHLDGSSGAAPNSSIHVWGQKDLPYINCGMDKVTKVSIQRPTPDHTQKVMGSNKNEVGAVFVFIKTEKIVLLNMGPSVTELFTIV